MPNLPTVAADGDSACHFKDRCACLSTSAHLLASMPKLNTCTDTAAAADAAPTLLPPPLIPTIRHQPQVLIHNCNLSNSSSGDGGAVAAWGTAYVVVHDSRIKFSSATDRGGGVCFNENSRGNLIRLLLTNNSAGLEGGGLAVYDSAKVCAGTTHRACNWCRQSLHLVHATSTCPRCMHCLDVHVVHVLQACQPVTQLLS